MFSRSKDPHIYVFHHVPKCGGTSMKAAFGRWFRRKNDYRPPWAEGRRLERFKNRPLDLDRLKPGSVVCGHFEVDGIYLHQRYPQVLGDERFRVVTFVRDPFPLRLSLLRHEMDHGRLTGDEPIEELLMGRPNWLCERFPCDLETMDEVLDRYFFIGITENSQAEFDHLADRIGQRRLRLPWRNKTRKREFPITDEMRQRFRRVHHLDFQLYERCLERRRLDRGP